MKKFLSVKDLDAKGERGEGEEGRRWEGERGKGWGGEMVGRWEDA